MSSLSCCVQVPSCNARAAVCTPHLIFRQLCVQREVFGDTFDLATADAADLPLDAVIPGTTLHLPFILPVCIIHHLDLVDC